jgi:hypothetical protein
VLSMDAALNPEPLAGSRPIREIDELPDGARRFRILSAACVFAGATVTVTWADDDGGEHVAEADVDADADPIWWDLDGDWPDDGDHWNEVAAAALRAYNEQADDERLWGNA